MTEPVKSELWSWAIARNIADTTPRSRKMHRLDAAGWLTVIIVVLMFASAVAMWWLS